MKNENVFVHFCDSQELKYVFIIHHPTSYPTMHYIVPTLDAHVDGRTITPLSSKNVFLHFEYLLGVCITYVASTQNIKSRSSSNSSSSSGSSGPVLSDAAKYQEQKQKQQ